LALKLGEAATERAADLAESALALASECLEGIFDALIEGAEGAADGVEDVRETVRRQPHVGRAGRHVRRSAPRAADRKPLRKLRPAISDVPPLLRLGRHLSLPAGAAGSGCPSRCECLLYRVRTHQSCTKRKQPIDRAQRYRAMDSTTLTKIRADRLRLRAELWRRDAKGVTNRQLSQLMLRTAKELEEEATGLDQPRQEVL
jgi:hypothetical protein